MGKSLQNRGFFENRDAQDLKNFVQAEIEMQPFLEDGHQDINADGDPDLDFDSILRSTVKGLDPEMLFDPAEKQFHLPACTIQLGNGQSGKMKFVGEENEPQVFLGIKVVDATKRSGVKA